MGRLAGLFRRLPPGLPGKARAARWLLGRQLAATDCWIEARGGLRFRVPSLREPVAFHLLVDGVYEPATASVLARLLRPGMRFVDVGANIGAHALPAARLVGPEGDVLALEPAPQVFPYLEANVAANGLRNVTALPLAAGEVAGPVPFYPAPADHFGMGSRAPQFHAEPVTVASETLDRVLARHPGPAVGLVKVDVEGFEAAVFAGAAGLLGAAGAPPVLFEFSDWAERRAYGDDLGRAQRRLLDYGYRLWRLEAWCRGRAPLSSVLTGGAAELLAVK